MYLSINWLKELVDFDYNIKELDNVLTMMGIEVEEIIDFSKKYENFITAKVLEAEKHPDADKLTICKVDTGTEQLSVICGAPNVAKGQSVILGLPGAIVPSNNLKLEKRKVRGVNSEGMICSQAELEVGTDASGIWVLPAEIKPGIPLSDYLKLNDIILNLSLTPNKSDCNSHLGIAREISAVTGNPVKIKKVNIKETDNDINNSIKVIIEDAEKCPRYSCRIIRDVKVQESPDWLKSKLTMLGLRPRNVVVDVTNYVLMELGQPLHAFDLNKITGNKIICKTAKNGEKFITLDSKGRILDDEMLMICDAEKSIAIGGVMGGENSEIDDNTTDVLLESAFFNPSSIRRTAKKLQIQSDASYRFERGVDINNIIFALNRAAQMIADLSGGMIDKGYIDVYPQPKEQLQLKLRFQRAKDIIGQNISNEKIIDILQRLNFEIITADDNECLVKVPFYRVDVSLEIDLIEEIARLYNYDNIEPNFSVSVSLDTSAIPEKLAVPKLRSKISNYFVNRGFNEIITQNMLDPTNAKIFEDDLIEISNPLGEELSIMRPSIVPAMLKTIEKNLRLSSQSLKFFEIGKTFHKLNLPKSFIENIFEKQELIVAIAGQNAPLQWGLNFRDFDFYDIKGICQEFFDFFGYNYKFIENKNPQPIFNSNSLTISINNQNIGSFGEVSEKLLKKFDVSKKVFILNIDLSMLYDIEPEDKKYQKVSPYPSVNWDLAFLVDKNLPSKNIYNEILQNGGKYLKSLEIFDVFEGKSLDENIKSIAFNLNFSSMEKTLSDDEIEPVINKIISKVEQKFNAKLRKR